MREMKNSGVEWLESIPETWNLLQLGSLFSEHKHKNIGMQSSNLLSLSYGKIIRKDINTTDGLLPESFEGYNVIGAGDIVLRLTDLQNDQRSLRVGLCGENGIITSAYTTLRRRNDAISSKYFYYLLHSYDVRKGFYGMGAGVRQGLNYAGVRKIMLAVPSEREQTAIAECLDQKIAQVDALIANVQAQIEKLKAYKQSLITEVVTKGLDPNAPMKDSGVEWIGKIPAHWGTAKLQYCAELRSGITLGKKYPKDIKLVERPYLRVANVQSGGVTLENIKTVQVTEEEDVQYRLTAGEVLMTEGGDRDKLGRGCVWNGQIEPCLHQNHIFALRTSKNLDPQFLSYVTASKIGRVYFDITAIKTTNLACTNSSKVLAFKLPLPPITEQQRITVHLNNKCSQIEQLISLKESKIEKLQQYKRSLIYEYVTGKKEVV